MATLKALGTNLAIGGGVFVVSLLAFAAAIHWEWNSELAPRTWARPRQVIKNVLTGPAALYGIAWIPWALSLSYKQLLDGIPGTGTRKFGWSGALLKCNLDGIIAIKFHALCFKVAVFATVVCICLVLPINLTAKCDPEISGETLCNNMTSLTNFEVTTLAHIPPMDFVDNSDAGTRGLKLNGAAIASSLDRYFWTAPGITSRLFTIVFSAFAIFIYTSYLIWNEWIDNLALRRVFYLEHDHFAERKTELDYLATLQDPELEFQKRRPPYIPHPEVRDTVPNISLYSALYKLPYYYQSTASAPNASMLDRQLSNTVDFFDKAIPNQPFFSSSVAAVTILPDPSQVANAWKKWYNCAKKIRRLRFIRRRIQELESLEQSARNGRARGSQPPQQGDGGDEEEEIQFHNRRSLFAPSFASDLDSSHAHSGSSTADIDQMAVIEEGGEESRKSSPNSTSALLSSTSARCSYTQKISTVDEQEEDDDDDDDDDEMMMSSTSDTTDIGDNKSPLLPLPPRVNPLDIESAGSLQFNIAAGTMEPSVKLAASTRDLGPDAVDDRYILEKNNSDGSLATNPEQQKSPPNDGPVQANTDENVDASNQVCFDSTPFFSSSFGSPTESLLPSPTSGSMSPPVSYEEISTLDWRHCMPSEREVRRLSPVKAGLAEEAKLDMFISDDEMEQLSVYCRESAQSSAACCPYGCDYQYVLRADMETLKELEEEAEEMVQEANLYLIEARASVNKMEIDFETDERPNGSFIGPIRQGEVSLPSLEAYSSGSFETQMEDRVGQENIVVDRGNPQSLVQRNTSQQLHSSASSERLWRIAGEIANDNRAHNATRGRRAKLQRMPSGRWHLDFGDLFVERLRKYADQPIFSLGLEKPKKEGNPVKNVIEQHTYAVVTFTSRQAAIAARQCTADGSGLGRWEELEDLPIPPLADSPPWDIFLCRACCRPVTLTINDSQKRCRRNCTWLSICLFCCLYTIPLALTSNLTSDLLSTAQVSTSLPTLNEQLSGIITGLLYTGFFSICPFIFKAFANFGSGATSQRQAEYRAIRYYWIFMLVTAFTGSSLATMVTSGLYTGLNLGESAQEVLRQVAKTIPTQVSATWLNWIIVRFLVSVPVLYLLQSNTFLFRFGRMECCARCTRGGGPGGPLPFRIYVDSGVVFLCIVALAPVCPLVAPAAMLYFLIFTPVLRWLLIFVYRPLHDGGGQRWPLLHEILISSMIVAQILLTTMMVLKKGFGPAFLCAISILPTFFFGQLCKDRFLRCYQDAGLVQTSQLDGWDSSQPKSFAELEVFRKWLVDCHKAAYVPICLSGADNFLTVEPAVVLPTERDTPMSSSTGTNPQRPRRDTMDSTFVAQGSVGDERHGHRPRLRTMDSDFISVHSSNRSPQKGALFRRVPHSINSNF